MTTKSLGRKEKEIVDTTIKKSFIDSCSSETINAYNLYFSAERIFEVIYMNSNSYVDTPSHILNKIDIENILYRLFSEYCSHVDIFFSVEDNNKRRTPYKRHVRHSDVKNTEGFLYSYTQFRRAVSNIRSNSDYSFSTFLCVRMNFDNNQDFNRIKLTGLRVVHNLLK